MNRSDNTAGITVLKAAENAGERGFAYLLAFFTLPNIFLVPSFSFLPLIFGIPAIWGAMQMLFGRQQIWLPDIIGRQKIPASILLGHERLVAKISGAHKNRRPNSGFTRMLHTAPWRQAVALAAVLGTVLLCLPVPVLTAAPALGMLILISGLLRESRILVILGVVAIPLAAIAMYLLVLFLADL